MGNIQTFTSQSEAVSTELPDAAEAARRSNHHLVRSAAVKCLQRHLVFPLNVPNAAVSDRPIGAGSLPFLFSVCLSAGEEIGPGYFLIKSEDSSGHDTTLHMFLLSVPTGP